MLILYCMLASQKLYPKTYPVPLKKLPYRKMNRTDLRIYDFFVSVLYVEK